MESIAPWDDFLVHGALQHHGDPVRFSIAHLSEAQYTTLVDLADGYFASGYEFYHPAALRPEDQERLAARYATD